MQSDPLNCLYVRDSKAGLYRQIPFATYSLIECLLRERVVSMRFNRLNFISGFSVTDYVRAYHSLTGIWL